MRPGGWNPVPMLGADESLAERLAQDSDAVAALGTEAATLGRRLADALEAARDTDWFAPAPQGPLEVEVRRRRGIMTCPWAPEEYQSCGRGDGGKRAGANQFLARNRTTGRALEGFAMSAHLIAEHGFFGGLRTPFRVEPQALAELLEGA